MSTVTSRGVGSGLDVTAIIDSMVNAESAGQFARIDNKEIKTQALISAFSSIKGSLSQFQTTVSSMLEPNKFSSRKVTNSNDEIFTASATANAELSSYGVKVTQLATAHKLKSAAFPSTSTTIGTGTLTFQFGTYNSVGNTFTLNTDKTAKTVDISSTNNSLEGIRNAVNEAKIGVTASIINDGSGQRLVFTSNDTGAENSLKITVNDNDGDNTNNAGLSQLAYNPTLSAGSGKNLSETVAAVNANLEIDGISITNPSNSISDVIDGVTLTLKKADTDITSNLSINLDKNAIKAKVNTLVVMFNTFTDELKKLTAYDSQKEQASILTGDNTVRMVDSSLRSIVTSVIPKLTDTTYHSLSEIGVMTKANGSFELNATKLEEAIDNDPEAIARLFTEMGVCSDQLVDYVSGSDLTKSGKYSVNITQLATQGTSVGSVAADTTIIDGVNDTIVIKVDGATSTIKMSAGTYTSESLAAELESRISGVSVTESAGVLTFKSLSYGSESSVAITSGNGKTSLMGATATETFGVDVAGTIGGMDATGEGQYLFGKGNAADLKIQIAGGSLGDRGTVNYTRGVAALLNDRISGYLDSDGLFAAKEKSLNDRIGSYSKEREVINRRMLSYQKRLVAQFTAMDEMVSSLQSSGNFLFQQLNNMPIVTMNQKK